MVVELNQVIKELWMGGEDLRNFLFGESNDTLGAFLGENPSDPRPPGSAPETKSSVPTHKAGGTDNGPF